MPVRTMTGKNIIPSRESRTGTNGNRLLPNAKMNRAAHFLFRI